MAAASFSFTPQTLTIPAGSTVTWTVPGSDPAPHTATDAGVFDTGMINPGRTSAAVRFPTPGTYHYVCQYHGGAPTNMVGTIVVTAPAPARPSHTPAATPAATPAVAPGTRAGPCACCSCCARTPLRRAALRDFDES